MSDGDQAIAYLSGQGSFFNRKKYPLPSVAILDLKLPRLSGLDVVQWVRRQPPPLRWTPLIILTSSKDEIDVNRAYDYGVNSYVVKPLTFDGLVNVARALEAYWLATNQQPSTSVSSRGIPLDHATVSQSLTYR